MSRAKQNKAGMILLPRTSSILEQTVRHQLEMAQEVKNQDPSLDSNFQANEEKWGRTLSFHAKNGVGLFHFRPKMGSDPLFQAA